MTIKHKDVEAFEAGITLAGGSLPAEQEAGKLKAAQVPTSVVTAAGASAGLVPVADGTGKYRWEAVAGGPGSGVSSINGTKVGAVAGIAEIQETVAPVVTVSESVTLGKTPLEAQIWICNITATTGPVPKITLPAALKGASISVYIKYNTTVRVPEFAPPAGSTIRWEKGVTYSNAVETSSLPESRDLVSFLSPDGTNWDGFISAVSLK